MGQRFADIIAQFGSFISPADLSPSMSTFVLYTKTPLCNLHRPSVYPAAMIKLPNVYKKSPVG
jgi:hypothetical protein